MPSVWFKKHPPTPEILSIPNTLAKLYKTKLLPLEEHTEFSDFCLPLLDNGHFTSKPMVLLMGQYSTGKTTFLRYLVEQDFPGMRIGPEPTTDGFMSLEYDTKEQAIPGNAMVVDPDRPYGGLSRFGLTFLEKFQGSFLDSEVLKHVTLIDSPGILSGSKQEARGYDFVGVLQWFAERVDMIIILFDAHKLDISDELSNAIKALKKNESKMKIVLNKADSIDPQQLMSVHGALLWSLAKIFTTPEVIRVYCGSFWAHPWKCDSNRRLFELEKEALFHDLQILPQSYTIRLVNTLLKRARLALAHAYILQAVRNEIGQFAMLHSKKKIPEKLKEIYNNICRTHNLSLGDFPEHDKMKADLQKRDISRLPKFKKELVDNVLSLLTQDMPPLMTRIKEEGAKRRSTKVVLGGIFESSNSPFSEDFEVGANRGKSTSLGKWIVDEEKERWQHDFNMLEPNEDGKLDGTKARAYFIKTTLPNSTLGKIWLLSDVDKDGALDYEEFALMMHLIHNVALPGHPIPLKLPRHLVPPSKREGWTHEGLYSSPDLEKKNSII